MRVAVDQGRCVGSGACEQACPGVFELGVDGVVSVVEPDPGEALRPAVLEAAELCPTGAISVEG